MIKALAEHWYVHMCTDQHLCSVRAKIEECIRTMEIFIYQLARQPFCVSIEIKALFWLLFFCLPKNLKIGLDGLHAF